MIHNNVVDWRFFQKKNNNLEPKNICSLPTKWLFPLGYNISSLLWLALALLKPFVAYRFRYRWYIYIYIIYIYIYIDIDIDIDVLRLGYMSALAPEGGSRARVIYQIGFFFIFISFLFRRSTTCVIQYSQMIDNENVTLCFLKQIQHNNV